MYQREYDKNRKDKFEHRRNDRFSIKKEDKKPYFKKSNKQELKKEKLSNEEQIIKIKHVFEKYPFAKISKASIKGSVDDFIDFAAKNGINLVEDDERILLFGNKDIV